MPKKKNPPAAVRDLFLNPAAMEYFREQGRIGGKKGAKARLEKLTSEQRTEIAKKAVAAREAKRKRTDARAKRSRQPSQQEVSKWN